MWIKRKNKKKNKQIVIVCLTRKNGRDVNCSYYWKQNKLFTVKRYFIGLFATLSILEEVKYFLLT